MAHKWEYARLTHFRDDRYETFVHVGYSSNPEVPEWPEPDRYAHLGERLAQDPLVYLGKLGDEGWELVNYSMHPRVGDVWYLKRPVQDSS
jgi:hypothetical protein